MASSDISPTRQELPTAAPQPRRPLRREGAVFILTAEEQLLQDAMLMSSSPPPEPVLGKRTRQEGDNGEDDVEDDATTPALQLQTSLPSISNITAAALRYATNKKLRPEQREEVEAFLLVSFCFIAYSLVLVSETPQDSATGRQAKIFIAILSIENKIDTFRSAAPPYHVSEELKVCNHLIKPFNATKQSSQTNINNYGLAVLLSVNISAYKGNIPINHVLVRSPSLYR